MNRRSFFASVAALLGARKAAPAPAFWRPSIAEQLETAQTFPATLWRRLEITGIVAGQRRTCSVCIPELSYTDASAAQVIGDLCKRFRSETGGIDARNVYFTSTPFRSGLPQCARRAVSVRRGLVFTSTLIPAPLVAVGDPGMASPFYS